VVTSQLEARYLFQLHSLLFRQIKKDLDGGERQGSLAHVVGAQ
jgi:hypothetical protein